MQKATKAQLREIRELLRNKSSRDEKGVFAAEGQKLVRDILSAGHAVKSVLVSSKVLGSPAVKKIADNAARADARVLRVPAAEYEKLSSLKSSQGVMAVVKMSGKNADAGDISGDGPVVVLDGVQDPGNMGAIIRCAAAFGASGVILAGETVDVYNPKVVRASSGTLMNALILRGGRDEIKRLKEAGARLYASSCRKDGAIGLSAVSDEGGKVMIAFGSEGKGLSREIQEMADASFNIPIDENVESLNVTSAVAVTLYELYRRA